MVKEQEMAEKIAIGSDHAGYPLKVQVLEYLKKKGHEVIDLGTDSEAPVDYPDYAEKVGEKVSSGEADIGIVLCGSGVGASVAANKIRGVRAGLCHDTFSAHQGREDDDTNVLCMGARVIGPNLAMEVLESFLKAKFSGLERHQRRLNKVLAIESKYCSK
jgi:ribose 5-phosphate isomerase B